MTDRYNALTVMLDRHIRSDDAEPLISAIMLLKGVLRVEPHVADIDYAVAHARVWNEIRRRMRDAEEIGM